MYLCKTQLSAKADLEQVVKPLLPLEGVVRHNQKKQIYVDIPYTLSHKVRGLPLNTVEIPLTAYIPSHKPLRAVVRLSRSPQSSKSGVAWLKTDVVGNEIPLAYHSSVILEPPMTFLTYKRRRMGSIQDYIDFLKDTSRDFISKLSAFVGYGDVGLEFQLTESEFYLSGIVDTGIVILNIASKPESESFKERLLKYLDSIGRTYQIDSSGRIILRPLGEYFEIMKDLDSKTTLNNIVLGELRHILAVLLDKPNIKLEFY